jgi:hypothetical protein
MPGTGASGTGSSPLQPHRARPRPPTNARRAHQRRWTYRRSVAGALRRGCFVRRPLRRSCGRHGTRSTDGPDPQAWPAPSSRFRKARTGCRCQGVGRHPSPVRRGAKASFSRDGGAHPRRPRIPRQPTSGGAPASDTHRARRLRRVALGCDQARLDLDGTGPRIQKKLLLDDGAVGARRETVVHAWRHVEPERDQPVAIGALDAHGKGAPRLPRRITAAM